MQTSGEMRREIVKLYQRHCERSEAIHLSTCFAMHCFAEPVIRRRFAPTGWLAMTWRDRGRYASTTAENS
jgi:hypothetical protein